jgi:hypothetical protein
MNKLIPIFILTGIVISVLVFTSVETGVSTSKPIYDTGFTYYDIEIIQNILSQQNISVSAPAAITDSTINQYCLFFDSGKSKTVDYCTTTAISDSNGNPLGNINIGGDTVSPVMAIANLETSTLESNHDDVIAVFEAVIETLVCDCWDESGEYESISTWINAAHDFYIDSGNRNVKSKIDNLGDAKISLEITSNDDSVLQTLIILK